MQHFIISIRMFVAIVFVLAVWFSDSAFAQSNGGVSNNVRPVYAEAPYSPSTASRGYGWPSSNQSPNQYHPPRGISSNKFVSHPRSMRLPVGPVSVIEAYKGAQEIARVGGEVILLVDILPGVVVLYEKAKNQDEVKRIDAEVKRYLEEKLSAYIESKLFLCDLKRNVPAENFPRIEESIAKQFEMQEIPKMMKKAKAASRTELQEKLSQHGNSLQRQKRTFTEQVLARQWVQSQLMIDREVTYSQMLEYYQENQDEFKFIANARWQKLTVLFAKHNSRSGAMSKIVSMGNQALKGRKFEEIAKAMSEGPRAVDGGNYDWINKGSLRSEQIDTALFGLPVGRLSRIIEDETGVHIVRVIERKDDGITSFRDAQVDIRKKLQQLRFEKARDEYLAKLRREIPVTTIFDSEKDARKAVCDRSLEVYHNVNRRIANPPQKNFPMSNPMRGNRSFYNQPQQRNQSNVLRK